MSSDPPSRPAMTLGVLVLVLLFALWREQPPDALPADAPSEQFSAARARTALEAIATDIGPHPVGSAENAAVRDRIEAQLTALGLTVERQAAFSCRGIVCAPVVNLLAEVPGAEPDGPLVLLVSHYDSVDAGPGVGDDLHGVAVAIETARALLSGPTPRHPVRLLIDEGEEVGLLGAAAFVDRHPDARRVGAVINVEARGTSGRSRMFETGAGNGALVTAHLDAVPWPSATSLSGEIYKRMPNGSDFSVFAEAGMTGLNFAFIGNGGLYHTPLDDLANLDDRSVQHQGSNVLASARVLADGPLPVPRTDDLIYADFLGLLTVSWPMGLAFWVPLALCVLVGGLAGFAYRAGRLRLPRMSLGFVAVLGTLVGSVGVAFGIDALVCALQGTPVAAHASVGPMRVSLWLGAVAIAVLLAWGLRRACRPLELLFGVWMTWSLLALVLAATLPATSVMLCLPVGLALPGLAWTLRGPDHEPAGISLAALGLLAIGATLALALEAVFGFMLVPAVAVPMAIAVTAVLPGLRVDGPGARRMAAGLGLTLLSSVAVSSLVPVFTDERPRRIAVNHYDDRAVGDARLAVLAIDGLPESVREAGQLSAQTRPVLPWTGRPLHDGPAIAGGDPPPELSSVEGGEPGDPRRVRARLRSARGAPRAFVIFERPAAVHGVWVEGRAVNSAKAGRLAVFGLPAGGVIMDLELSGTEAVEATVVDCTTGLPPSAQAVLDARDAATAVTVQWGDLGCIATRAIL